MKRVGARSTGVSRSRNSTIRYIISSAGITNWTMHQVLRERHTSQMPQSPALSAHSANDSANIFHKEENNALPASIKPQTKQSKEQNENRRLQNRYLEPTQTRIKLFGGKQKKKSAGRNMNSDRGGCLTEMAWATFGEPLMTATRLQQCPKPESFAPAFVTAAQASVPLFQPAPIRSPTCGSPPAVVLFSHNTG